MIMKKRLLALLCALTLAVGAAACATSGSGENETNAQQTEDNNNTAFYNLTYSLKSLMAFLI